MSDIITDKEWLFIGKCFCNLRNDFTIHFYDKIKIVKKTRAFKYYDMFHHHFYKIAIILDDLILSYYPESVSHINDISIFDIFFTINDNNNYIKTNIELRKDLDYFISILQEKPLLFKKTKRYLNLILKKLDKVISLGYID